MGSVVPPTKPQVPGVASQNSDRWAPKGSYLWRVMARMVMATGVNRCDRLAPTCSSFSQGLSRHGLLMKLAVPSLQPNMTKRPAR